MVDDVYLFCKWRDCVIFLTEFSLPGCEKFRLRFPHIAYRLFRQYKVRRDSVALVEHSPLFDEAAMMGFRNRILGWSSPNGIPLLT